MIKDIGNLMRQAQQVKENMEKAQAALADLEAVGESGAGMVKITMNGKHEAKKVWIEPKVLAEDKGLIEDLIAAAVNDAARKIDALSRDKMSGVMAGLNLPAGLKLPF